MALANSRNNFDLLSSSQEPSQLIAQATNTAKNRKKKEKAKDKKTAPLAEPVESSTNTPQPRRSNDLEKQAAPAQKAVLAQYGTDYGALQRQFAQDAQNRDCWSVWDEWLRRVRHAAADVAKRLPPSTLRSYASLCC